MDSEPYEMIEDDEESETNSVEEQGTFYGALKLNRI